MVLVVVFSVFTFAAKNFGVKFCFQKGRPFTNPVFRPLVSFIMSFMGELYIMMVRCCLCFSPCIGLGCRLCLGGGRFLFEVLCRVALHGWRFHTPRGCCQVFPDVNDVPSFFAFLCWEVFVYFMSSLWAFQSVRHLLERLLGECVAGAAACAHSPPPFQEPV